MFIRAGRVTRPAGAWIVTVVHFLIQTKPNCEDYACKFLLDDGSIQFVSESEITSEIEMLMASLGSPSHGLQSSAL